MENGDNLPREANGGSDGDTECGGDYLSVADDTGTVHVMVVPDHLRGQTNDDLVIILPDKVYPISIKIYPKGFCHGVHRGRDSEEARAGEVAAGAQGAAGDCVASQGQDGQVSQSISVAHS